NIRTQQEHSQPAPAIAEVAPAAARVGASASPLPLTKSKGDEGLSRPPACASQADYSAPASAPAFSAAGATAIAAEPPAAEPAARRARASMADFRNTVMMAARITKQKTPVTMPPVVCSPWSVSPLPAMLGSSPRYVPLIAPVPEEVHTAVPAKLVTKDAAAER